MRDGRNVRLLDLCHVCLSVSLGAALFASAEISAKSLGSALVRSLLCVVATSPLLLILIRYH